MGWTGGGGSDDGTDEGRGQMGRSIEGANKDRGRTEGSDGGID